ncbi:hypothetical protein K2173_002095 [Erythroxylum novogranatense]|uniref:AMP-activated protein kinase glycogen-binding domain-containing protein n=1 Tax=Erythroxylum novogranatense TaxID=1862640 RepID=A0AAV8SPL9_9ROSI|nr:hypothetical protein K2173_002095 [Erythroxylum novogranatense]
MAISVCKFPCALSPTSASPCLSIQQHQLLGFGLRWKIYEYPYRERFKICACSVKKSRRKVKSNAELCNDIREFLMAVGLPDDHVPTMKELSDEGRTDLANIVRRRGYKFIRNLLSSSVKADTDVPDLEKRSTHGQDLSSASKGQDEKVRDAMGDALVPPKVLTASGHFDSLVVDLEHDSGDHSYNSLGIPLNSSSEEMTVSNLDKQDEDVQNITVSGSLPSVSYATEPQDEDIKHVKDGSMSRQSSTVEPQDKEICGMVEDISLETEVSVVNNNQYSLKAYEDISSDENNSKPLQTSANFPLESEVLSHSKNQDENKNNMAEETLSATDYGNYADTVPECNNTSHGLMPMHSTQASTLEEVAAKFIESGDLDVIEDDAYGILKERDGISNEGFDLKKSTDMRSKNPSKESFGHAFSMSNPASTKNGIISRPELAAADDLLRDGCSAADAYSGKELDAATTGRQNQVDINHLKSMLYEKELELSRLKELVDREKLALSALQTKAEIEISKAQKLISEKDAELIAAEESLSGLVEVKIQYCGEGDVVEVTGSFNGWHHRIRMDPQPFSTARDSTGSRKSRVWSTMLWLYPGVYEIKFIVDGHWKVDPLREVVTGSGISNNILRVDG